MKLRLLTLFTLSVLFFVSNTQAQVAYPRFQKHTVLAGETAKDVVAKFNVTLQDFCLLNDFPDNVILKPNQVVLIKQLQDGEKEIVEDAPLQKAKPAKKEEHAAAPAAEEKPKEEKAKPAPVKTTPSEPVAAKKTEPAPAKTTTFAVEKPKPAPVKKEVAEEPFVVPPPSTKAVEVGPHGVTYNVSKTGYHVVAKNQTFFRIALIYGMSVDELKELNGLTNTTVEIGQKLKVRKD